MRLNLSGDLVSNDRIADGLEVDVGFVLQCLQFRRYGGVEVAEGDVGLAQADSFMRLGGKLVRFGW